MVNVPASEGAHLQDEGTTLEEELARKEYTVKCESWNRMTRASGFTESQVVTFPEKVRKMSLKV